MHFSEHEMEKARQLHELGLHWDPQPGHYVWDQDGLIEKTSPFQPGVYFILDLKHFLRRAASVEALKQMLVWLPTWHDARETLQELGVGNTDVTHRLASEEAIEHGNELLVLYELIAEQLKTGVEET